MSIRSQDLDTNALLLYPLGKGASSHEAAPAYSFPQDDEDSDGGQGSALRDGEEEGTVLKLSLQVDVQEKVSNESVETDVQDTNGTSAAAPIDPTVLPAGYGAAIIASFLAMIKYLNEMSQQGYQVTAYSANAMIGTDNKPGLIQSWVDAGMSSAQAQGDQLSGQAIGSLVSGGLCGLSFLCSIGGFFRNSTSIEIGNGMYKNDYSKISEQLEDAQSYRDMLDKETRGDVIAQSEREIVPERAAANQQAVENELSERMAPMDKKSAELKAAMIEKANTEYKANRNGQLSEEAKARNEEIKLAAKHLNTQEETAAAKEKADKRIESLQNQLGQCEGKQNNWVNTLSSFTQASSAGGQALGGLKGSDAAIEAGKQKANSDALQQTSQTTEGVKEKATQQAQGDRDQMGQMAQAMAQALASQTQSRA